jgi:hypothetical protein
MKTSIMVLFGASLALVAPAAAREPSRPDIYDGMQVGIGRCLFVTPRDDPAKSRFLQAFAAAAITKGVNLLGTALTKAGSEKTWKSQQGRNFQAAANDFPECVQLVRGTFYRNASSVSSLNGSLASKQAELKSNGLYLAGDPDFLFEARFIAAGDGAGLALRPIKTIFSKPLGKRALRGTERSLAVFISITAPGTLPTLETAPAATMVLGRMATGSEFDYVDPQDVSSPYESSWFSLKREDARKPLTLTALVTETQGEDAFLTFVGGLLAEDEVKKDMSKAIQMVVLPSVRGATEYAETTVARSAQSLANERFAAAQRELLACRAASADTTTEAASKAKSALLNFLIADQDPKVEKPLNLVTESQINSIDMRSPSLAAQACDRLYNQLVSPA